MKIISISLIIVQIIFLSSCSSTFISKTLTRSSDSLHHHTGFVLYDPQKKKNLFSINGDKYFTPASNTKILPCMPV
jgi:D-alanyl-D-alanine carboxypeptidase/D-alanyl-D-alanine-endopeptidase (penicillin-binding protein 4)